jgi:hypothetical protein
MRPTNTPTHAAGLSLAASFALITPASAQPPAPTAGDIDQPAVLNFRVTDPHGVPIPCRLAFVDPQGHRPNLFTNPDAQPLVLAVRRNTVYTIAGEGRITVPPGRYTVWATHGLEWSIASAEVDLRPGVEDSIQLRLVREVDTSGWVSGDFHLHTLTYSGHGDSNLPERIISLVGEGVEFAVATDHNHNTDYHPTMNEVGADGLMTAVTGNEVSTSVGHFNAFPLEPGAPPAPFRLPSAKPLFAFLREQTNRYGVTPVIQLNHPRWGGINYFGHASLDPVTGVSESEVYSDDFDTIEIFNENEGWGYYDPDVDDVPIDSGTFSVLRDWFNLLNRGNRYAAVGNSDSHDVESEVAGYPRNFVRSSTDDPGAIDVVEICENQRAKSVFTTTGPFIRYTVNGSPMGADTTAVNGKARVRLELQAASWIDCDIVKVVVNGDIVKTVPVPDTRDPLRLRTEFEVDIPHDAWLTLLAEGDESLHPIVQDQGRPILPLAVMNPVWIDADADGEWRSPFDRAKRLVQEATNETSLLRAVSSPESRPNDRAMVAQAIGAVRPAYAAKAIGTLLHDPDRQVRLSAARAAEMIADPAMMPALDVANDAVGNDTHMRMALFGARMACAPASRSRDQANEELVELLTSGGRGLLSRFSDRITPLLGGDFVRDWLFVGMFPSENAASVVTLSYPPEQDEDASGTFETKSGPASWRPLSADRRGYVNLLGTAPGSDSLNNSIAYLRTWLVSPDDREVIYTLGTDDGSRLWINNTPIFEDPTGHGADPLQQVGRVRLNAGANPVLLKVGNGGGDFGAFFRVLDAEITVTTSPGSR